MNGQHIFDLVARHLRKQNKKAEGFGSAMYHASDGCMCAIGSLIQDGEYRDWMEFHDIQYVLHDARCPTSMRERLLGHEDLLMSLQAVHDRFPPEKWESALETVAVHLKLNYSPSVPES